MKPFRVVCINNTWYIRQPEYKHLKFTHPVKDEIYEIESTYEYCGNTYYVLVGYPDRGYNYDQFRELDYTFGPAVCEQIEQIIELEETIEI